jgi:hypothetical protein
VGDPRDHQNLPPVYSITARLVFDVGRPGYQQFGEIIRSQWDAIGVEAQLQPVERQVMI